MFQNLQRTYLYSDQSEGSLSHLDSAFLTDRMWCTHEVDKALEMVLVVRSAMSDQYEVVRNRLRNVRI